MARVSVVIVSKDEPSLSETLETLRGQCEDAGAECVVVDASEGRLDVVRLAHPWVQWHDFVAPSGRSITIPHQRNVGVQRAAGDVISFCDAGGLPSPTWLSSLTAPILRGDAVATGGPIRSRRASPYGTLNDLPGGSAVRRVVTCNFAITRTLLDRVGGFDERFDYGSDTVIGWQIERAGESVLSVSEAVVTMDWGDRRRQLRRDLRYGEAKARQFLLLPAERPRLLRESPEVLVYPLVFFTLPIAVAAALVTRRLAPMAPSVVCLTALLARDVQCRRPPGAMADHVVVSVGILHELAQAALTTRRRGRAPA